MWMTVDEDPIEQDKVDDFRWYVEGELDGAKIKPLVHVVETTM